MTTFPDNAENATATAKDVAMQSVSRNRVARHMQDYSRRA